jgi:N-methylhydantoinase A
MASAIHVVTVQRGLDPRDHMLIAFGGAGPMHVVGVARRFGIERVMAPPEAGVASAIGMQATDLKAEHGQTHVVSPERLRAEEAESLFQRVEAIAREKMGLEESGADAEEVASVERSIDVRFVGQAHELSIPVPDSTRLEKVPDAFRARYRELYGVVSQGAIEYAAFRVRLRVRVDRPGVTGATPDRAGTVSESTRRAWFGPSEGVATRFLTRQELATLGSVSGPAIVEGPVDTLVVPPDWSAEIDGAGSIHVSLVRA